MKKKAASGALPKINVVGVLRALAQNAIAQAVLCEKTAILLGAGPPPRTKPKRKPSPKP